MSGFQSFPLSTGSSDNPAYTAGSPVRFYLSTLPKGVGKMAYYLYGIFLTFQGSIVQSGGAGSAFFDARLANLLIDYLSLQGSLFGTPLSSQNVKGYWLPTIGMVGSGYNTGLPVHPAISSGAGTYNLSKTFFVPLGLGNGDRPHHTSQLNVLYKNAFLEIGCQSAGVLAALSTGATFSGVTIRASAACFPEPEIRVGPGVEWIDYPQVASAGQQQVLISGFGNSTQLVNTEQGAAIAFAMAMSSLQGQPGSFDPANLTQVTVPFRNQTQTNHVTPLLAAAILSMGERRPMGASIAYGGAGTQQLDTSDWPYITPSTSPNNTVGQANELVGLVGFPLVPQATNVQLSKLQVVSGDASYYLSMSAGPTGIHHTLVQHVRSWAPQMWADALKAVGDAGLISDVFGPNAGDLAWQVKALSGKSAASISPSKLRFLPMSLKPKAAALRRQARG